MKRNEKTESDILIAAASLHSSGWFMLKMFRNRKYYNPDFSEWNRRFKRHFEGNFSYRKFFLILFCLAIVLLYIGPYIFAWLFSSPVNIKGEHRRWMWHNLFAFKLSSSQSKYRLTYVLIDSEQIRCWDASTIGWHRSIRETPNSMFESSIIRAKTSIQPPRCRLVNALFRMWATDGSDLKSTKMPAFSLNSGDFCRNRWIIIRLRRFCTKIDKRRPKQRPIAKMPSLWTTSMGSCTSLNASEEIFSFRTIFMVSSLRCSSSSVGLIFQWIF